jgi:uncharacterized repeat protein (TIGR01451 family)
MMQKSQRHLARVFVGAAATLAALFGLSSSAWAGVGFLVVPNLPSPLVVGQTGVPASLTFTNGSNGAQAALNVAVSQITLVPSCGTRAISGGDCPVAAADPTVLRLSGTGTGEAGTACAGVTFTTSISDAAQGKYQFAPSSPVTLGPFGSATQTCIIDFTVDVVRTPTKDADPAAAGLQTDQIGFAFGVATDGQPGGGFGTNQVAINPTSIPIATQVSPGAITLPATFHDTASIGPAPAGAITPTGTVTFNVYGPADATCAAAPVFTSTNPVNAAGTGAVSLDFTPTAGGTYRVIASYSGDANYAAVATRCNDAGESVQVSLPVPSIGVTKTPSPTSLPAPGGGFQFTVVVTNTSSEALTLTSLTDNVYGNLNGKGTCGLGATLAASGGTYTCAFTGNFTGVAGASQTDTVTPVGTDSFGQTATATAQATVTLTPAGTPPGPPVPSIAVTKTPSPTSLPAPGGTFTFTVVVTNTSTEALTLTSLTDNVYGNLSGKGTCATGATLAASGGTYTCKFSGTFTGAAGATQTDTVTPVATDSGGRTATSTAKATVTLTPQQTPAAVLAPTRLNGPASCVQSPFRVGVGGSGIKRVTFSLNGKRVGVSTKRDSSGRFSIRITPSSSTKVQRVTAKVEYTAKKFGTTKTVTKTFGVCTTPRFTG